MVEPVNGIPVICAWEPCSKSFLAFPSRVRQHPKLYCSRECMMLGNAVTRTRSVTLICDNPACQKPFKAYPFTLNRGSKVRCCSRTCRAIVVAQQRFPGTFEEKFWAQVLKGKPDDCWPWQGRRSRENGYGMIYVPETQMDTGAHIVAFYFAHGCWPSPAMYVCHTCDFPPCVNERHLWEGTALDNAQDAMLKGRTPSGERHHASKITDAEWQEILLLLATSTLPRQTIAAQYGISYAALTRREKGSTNMPLEKRRKTIKPRLPRP